MLIPGVVASGYYVNPAITGLTLPGTSGNYASVPDSNDLDVAGDLTIMFDGALTDWTPAAGATFLTKSGAAGQRSYRFFLGATGLPKLDVCANGTAITTVTSSTAPTVADGANLAVGVTWRASDGRTQFWSAPSGTTTAPGGVGWTQLGTNQTANVGSLFNSTTAVGIGASTAGTAVLLIGVVKRVRIWASIDGTDLRLDADFTGVTILGTRNPTTLTDAAKGATVTVNGSAWGWAA